MTILMSSNFSRVVLAAGLLVGGLSFSSCSQDASPSMEKVDSVNYTRVPLSLSGVEAVMQPLEESSARALSFELNDSQKKFPKITGLKEGTKVLCVIRSSNINQPVNYIQATWTKKANTTNPTYTLSFTGDVTKGSTPSPSETTFAYKSNEDLGKLSMMLITGGEWDPTTKRLNVEPKLVRADGATMDYDVPCVSEWRPLDYAFKNGPSDPSSLSIALKGHDPNVANAPLEHYTLKPVGMLLRMPVEEEMAENGGGHYRLNGITIRSTAFAGRGYFNLSESNVRSTGIDVINGKERNYRNFWTFTYGSEQDDAYTVTNPIEHSFDATGVQEYGVRKLRRYEPRYYLFLWVMPRGQQPDAVTTGGVRTQIYADVDVVPLDGRPVIYSNSSVADEWELQGHNGQKYAVVPRMKALPAYASDRLVVKNNADAAFVEGTSYTLTLNLNRPDLPLELLSQFPVNKDFNGFSFDKDEVHFVPTTNAKTEIADVERNFRANLNTTSWSIPIYERFSLIAGTLFGKGTLSPSATILDDDTRAGQPAKFISADAFGDAGNFGVNKFENGKVNVVRLLLGMHSKPVGDKYVTYTLMFYPPMQKGKGNDSRYNRRGDRLCIMRGEYVETSPYGGPAYKITMRYLGTYSNDIGIISPNLPEVEEADQKAVLAELVDKIIAKGDTYWEDNLRKKDDITRYFPMWQKDPTNGNIYTVNDANYNWGPMSCMPFNTGSVTFVYYGKHGIGYDAIGRSSGYEKLTRQAPILLMRDRLTRK